MPFVFVYGTLQRGEVRDDALVQQRLVGAAVTKPRYRLFNVGSFPGLIDAAPGAGRAIQGELYEVSAECLATLDEIEGTAAGLYARRPIALGAPFASLACEAYFYLGDVRRLPDLGDRWPRRRA